MNCNQAAESVSALCDGEIIPPNAAEHIGSCAECQARLRDYSAMGIELRRIASLDASELIPERTWTAPPTRGFAAFWKKGRESMRIPKFAFALLVVAIVALASSLAVVKVGAHSTGSVLLLDIKPNANTTYRCTINIEKASDPCATIFSMNGRMAGLQIEQLARVGARVQLGIRTLSGPMNPNGNRNERTSRAELSNQPQTQQWFEVGETLRVPIDGVGTAEVTGEWTDHVPTLMGENQLDPGPGELRLVSPLLLRDKQTIADIEGSSATGTGMAVFMYKPGVGRFLLSLAPMKEAVQADARLNRISFQISGHDYLFLTGAPVTRDEHLWARYEPDFKPVSREDAGLIGAAPLKAIAPEAVIH